jgi:hypothetical protein
MRSRSGIKSQQEDLSALTPADLEDEISRAEGGLQLAANAFSRKYFFRRLTWLEAYRETVHGVAAPRRSMRARREKL